MRVVIEEGVRSAEEVVEEADVGFCLDEAGNLYVRKLVMLLKQEYNFSLESTRPLTQTRKSTTSSPQEKSGSTAASTPSLKICASGPPTGRAASCYCGDAT
jgi:hypothetical protein